MTVQEFWQEFCKENKIDESTPYEAWQFGADPDGLADLVVKGVKTATASAYELYALDGEPLPQVGDLSVVLNSQDEPVCVIQTILTKIVPFDEVDARQAYLEGEGDRSLAYWRKVHEDFFRVAVKSISKGRSRRARSFLSALAPRPRRQSL